MLVDLKRGKQLKITLSAVEICDYFGSFEEMRYDNEKTKAALGNILLRATDSTGFVLSGKRLFIKVFPTAAGGCTIYFTVAGDKKRYRRIIRSYIYEFENCENMLLVCEQIKLLSRQNTEISIYSNGDLYRIIISENVVCRALLALGPEYADRVLTDSYETEKTKEHWRALCVNTPVDQIAL